MGRSPRCDESSGLKKGPWTPEEDHLLIKYIQKHGYGSWRALPKLARLNRCGKSCRLRWTNYLRPDIKRGKFSQDEEQTILHLHSILGNKWSAIASHLPGRTDNEIKNFWNTHLKKKLIQMGFDPKTHRPRTDVFSSLPDLVALANLKELIDHRQQDDQTMIRLQEAAVQMAKLQYLQLLHQPQSSLANSTASTITDMDSYNLLNSLACTTKDCPILGSSLPQLDLATLSSLQQGLNDISNSVSFSHLPDLQVPGSYQTPILDKGMVHSDQFNSSNCSWIPTPSSTLSLPAAAPVTQTYSSINNMGDASTTSSHGGEAPTSWPAELLLQDPFFHEIA